VRLLSNLLLFRQLQHHVEGAVSAERMPGLLGFRQISTNRPPGHTPRERANNKLHTDRSLMQTVRCAAGMAARCPRCWRPR
jgi:hypothetical protein